MLNPGTRPAVPPVEGLAGTPYWTNRDAVQLTELPGSLVVVGGGPIGCEMAQVFARFGVRVTVVQHGPRLVPADEPEAAELLEKVFVEEGIRVLTDVELQRASYADGAVHPRPRLRRGAVVADKLLVAAGRTPNLDDLGLETVGLDPAARTLEVDDRLRVQDGIWAIGDVTGKGAFTHVSMYQSAVALRDILGQGGPRRALPRGPARDLHRSGDRRGRDDRAAGPRRRAERAHRPHPAGRSPRAVSPTARVGTE